MFCVIGLFNSDAILLNKIAVVAVLKLEVMEKSPLVSRFLMLVCVASLSSCALQQNVVLQTVPATKFDAIIVPGFPFDDEEGQMNTFQRMRLFWAYHLYSTGVTERIIVSGGAVHTPYVEAEIFAHFLCELGVNPKHIIIENKAEHSTENVFYSLEMARNLGFTNVAVATDPMQTMMLRFLLRKIELPVHYVPTDIKLIAQLYWRQFGMSIDGSGAFVDNFVPLKMREKRKERMRGTKGERYLEKVGEEQLAEPLTNR